MAEEKTDREQEREKQSEKITDAIKSEINEIRSRAESAREQQRTEGETEEEYYERVRNVPGFFGDLDTTGLSGVAQTPVADQETATVDVAANEANSDEQQDQDSRARAAKSADANKTNPAEVQAGVEKDPAKTGDDENAKNQAKGQNTGSKTK